MDIGLGRVDIIEDQGPQIGQSFQVGQPDVGDRCVKDVEFFQPPKCLEGGQIAIGELISVADRRCQVGVSHALKVVVPESPSQPGWCPLSRRRRLETSHRFIVVENDRPVVLEGGDSLSPGLRPVDRPAHPGSNNQNEQHQHP